MEELNFESREDAYVYFSTKLPSQMTNEELIYLCVNVDTFMSEANSKNEHNFWHHMKSVATEVLESRGLRVETGRIDLTDISGNSNLEALEKLPDEVLDILEERIEKFVCGAKWLSEMIKAEKTYRSTGKRPEETPGNNLHEKTMDELLEMFYGLGDGALKQAIKSELKKRNIN